MVDLINFKNKFDSWSNNKQKIEEDFLEEVSKLKYYNGKVYLDQFDTEILTDSVTNIKLEAYLPQRIYYGIVIYEDNNTINYLDERINTLEISQNGSPITYQSRIVGDDIRYDINSSFDINSPLTVSMGYYEKLIDGKKYFCTGWTVEVQYDNSSNWSEIIDILNNF